MRARTSGTGLAALPLVQRGPQAGSGVFGDGFFADEPQHVGQGAKLSAGDRQHRRQDQREGGEPEDHLDEEEQVPGQGWGP